MEESTLVHVLKNEADLKRQKVKDFAHDLTVINIACYDLFLSQISFQDWKKKSLFCKKSQERSSRVRQQKWRRMQDWTYRREVFGCGGKRYFVM